MSADNGIYVANFSDGPRVAHAQAIENCWYPNEENAESIVDYFEKAPVFNTLTDAHYHAHVLEHEIYESDFPILEYGVQTLHFDHPFSFYEQEAKEQRKFNKEFGGES